MKRFNRLELLTIKSALMLDEYVFKYFPNEYAEKIGVEELLRVKHVNSLITTIADNNSELIEILRCISEDLDYLSFQLKSGSADCVEQLNDAYDLLEILNQVV